MNVIADRPRTAALPKYAEDTLRAGLLVLAAYHLALAAFMAIAPHAFYKALGPFGPENVHYIRDNATFSAALAAGLLVSIRHPGWRVPMLAVVTIQFVLHALNHLLDIGKAHPAWVGYFDFASLAASAAALLWLLSLARRQARASRPRSKGDRP
ncbi:MAG TPA: hypothetical protein VN772_06190 [Solirubrobacteraceae bacterium]|nr:hypothetical protein [Solirubrobacteraceae bacterium]